MTVKYESEESNGSVMCVWFRKNEYFTDPFEEECITLVPVEDSIDAAIS